MQKVSINEAAQILGVSKEAVYNRIRRNTLKYVVEGDSKFVLLDKDLKQTKTNTTKKTIRSTQKDERYIELLKQTIEELKQRVSKLEREKTELILQKEELLIQARKDVENIYKDKDKQLKQLLTVVTKPLLTYMKNREAIDAEFEDLSPYERGLVMKPKEDEWQHLEEYMDQKGYSYKKKKSINTQILEQVGKNKSIKEENGALFIKRGKKIKQILKEKS